MNKILPAGWGGHAVILSCCTMGNLTPDIFPDIFLVYIRNIHITHP